MNFGKSYAINQTGAYNNTEINESLVGTKAPRTVHELGF